MDSITSTALYPLHRSKTLHLVRHAQGVHNVEGEKDHRNYMSELLFDANLTQLGWNQVDNLHNHVRSSGLSNKIELVVVSPLLRTMQTAVGVFGGEPCADGIAAPPFMVANAGNSNRNAISSFNSPPFLALELCREHLLFNLGVGSGDCAFVYPGVRSGGMAVGSTMSMGDIQIHSDLQLHDVHPCVRRRSISEYKLLFPAIDFSLIENNDDVLWSPDTREEDEDVAARGMKFWNWLWTREEKEIAVVSHSEFLYHALSGFGNDCHPTVKSEICTHFANCELRSMVIIDRGMMGSDSSKSNYPGKIPPGRDLPSDIADQKHPEILN